MPRSQLPRRVPDSDSQDLLDEFFAQADVSPLTIAKYRSQLTEFAVWLKHPRSHDASGPATTIRGALPRDVQRYLAYLRGSDRFAAAATVNTTAALAPSTRKTHLASIRSLYRYLLLVRVVDFDPSAGIRSPRVRISPGFRLSAEEIDRLLDAEGSARERVQTYLLVFTAARAGELRDLRWDDIDLRARTVTLCGKNGKYHIVDIHPRLMGELRRWLLHQQHDAEHSPQLAQALADPDTAFVLLTRTGRQLSAGSIAKQLRRRACNAGLYALDPAHGERRSRVSPHAIRRSIATLLLNDGHHIDAVADVLNHEQVDTTRRHYAFSSNARRRATIEAILT